MSNLKTLTWFAAVLVASLSIAKEKAPTEEEYLPKSAPTKTSTTGNIAKEKLLPLNDFSKETLGAEPKSFISAVGYWLIGIDGDKKVLVVDGRKWEEGQSSANLAEKARSIYGEKYAEFLDSVKAYAYFPFTVANYVDDFRDGEISVRFRPMAGKIDQAAGIIFDVKPNGDYLIVRANALEENLVLFQYVKGKRSSVKWIKNVPTPSKQWHDLKVSIQGKQIKAYLGGKLWLEHTLSTQVSGKIGLWSKADSLTYFTDFSVKPMSSKLN